MSTEIETYEATFEFQCGDKANGTSIIYLAHVPDAVDSAVRWIRSRQANVPEWFGAVYAVKVYRYRIGHITDDGKMTPPRGLPIFEWKFDWDTTLEEAAATRRRFIETHSRKMR